MGQAGDRAEAFPPRDHLIARKRVRSIRNVNGAWSALPTARACRRPPRSAYPRPDAREHPSSTASLPAAGGAVSLGDQRWRASRRASAATSATNRSRSTSSRTRTGSAEDRRENCKVSSIRRSRLSMSRSMRSSCTPKSPSPSLARAKVTFGRVRRKRSSLGCDLRVQPRRHLVEVRRQATQFVPPRADALVHLGVQVAEGQGPGPELQLGHRPANGACDPPADGGADHDCDQQQHGQRARRTQGVDRRRPEPGDDHPVGRAVRAFERGVGQQVAAVDAPRRHAGRSRTRRAFEDIEPAQGRLGVALPGSHYQAP